MSPDEATGRPIFLGRGALDWPAIERKGGRFGLIALYRPTGGPGAPWAAVPFAADAVSAHDGRSGGLLARVLERGRPYAPAPGVELPLGRGALFFEDATDEDGPAIPRTTLVGVRPDDGRGEDRLDPEALYDLHRSVVRLIFVPESP